MTERKGNLLIGKGERLIQEGDWSSSGRTKPNAYTIGQQRSFLNPVLESLAEAAKSENAAVAPRGEVTAKITMHPEFLAKSYFPSSVLKSSGLRLIGSRATDIQPRKMVHGGYPKELPTAILIVAGTADNYTRAATLLMSSNTADKVQNDFGRIECIAPFKPSDRKRGFDTTSFDGWAEVILHASLEDQDIINAFFKLSKDFGGVFNRSRARTIGGLTFLPVYVSDENVITFVHGVESFTHLRTIRNMPVVSKDPFVSDTEVLRSSLLGPLLTEQGAVNTDIRAVIFDGGFIQNKSWPWVNTIDAPGVPSEKTDISHGHAVTSAFLFGSLESNQQTVSPPFCNVDHVRVLPSTSTNTHVSDVIERILETLQSARDRAIPYSLANLSLGPRMPIIDDDPHEWTVRLDDFLSFGDLFMTVAVGNDGGYGHDLGRVQPPADAVNAFAVGASDGHHIKAIRAPYSCLGPGRCPGLVKPDVAAFGGTNNKPIQLLDPITGLLKPHAGTSYSAPLALRLAAGLQASIDQKVTPIMLHALLVSRAQFNSRQHNQKEVGWGILPATIDDILYSSDDEVVVMYQGLIAKGQPLRASIPLPNNLPDDIKVSVAATFAYRAPIDPAHPVSYTRAGLEIRFQPDSIKSYPFFSKTNYDTEDTLRNDALKWEACRHKQKKIDINKLTNPSFLIRYQGREEGAGDAPALKNDATKELLPAEMQPSALPFALIIRIKVPGITDLSHRVLTQFEVLSEVSLRTQVQT